jgi:monoamine oxidase
MKRLKILQAIESGLGQTQTNQKIIIIGAGVAGLTAAQILHKTGFDDITILEASPQLGGRVRTLKDFAQQSIELGAGEIHGRNSILFELIKKQDKVIFTYSDIFQEYYFIPPKLWSEDDLSEDFEDEWFNVLEVMEDLENYDGEEDISIADFLSQTGIDKKLAHLPESWISAEFGTNTENISIQNYREIQKNWTAGSQNFILKQDSFMSILEEAFEEIIPKILFEKPVQTVDYTQSKIQVITTTWQNFEADKVIVTVPLGVLKQNKITFLPELPPLKQQAIQTLGIDSGIKIILAFKQRFWADDLGVVYAKPENMIPEFYFSSQNHIPVLTGYVMGKKAKQLAESPEDMIQIALRELDEMFGKEQATMYFAEGTYVDWGQEPYILGAYSYPSFGADEARKTLAESVDNKLFFAGEATNYSGHPSTVHGAIETGYRVAVEIFAS